jgi:pimeloyl-ACP methyl ester carboxylesterase
MRRATSNLVRVNFTTSLPLLGATLLTGFTLGCSSDDEPMPTETGTTSSALTYEAGNATFCVKDGERGFNPTAGITEGNRLVIVEAWYPTAAAIAQDPAAVRTRFGDYFANDRDLLLRTERALLETTPWPADVIEEKIQLAPEQFEVTRGSFRNAPVSNEGPFPVVLYSPGTLQQRYNNDTMAENLARRGYIVLGLGHTGNDALAPFGQFCESEMSAPGVMPASLAENPAFDMPRAEYRGQTFDPFFLTGDAAPGGTGGVINPREVALTLDRVADYRAVLGALGSTFGSVGAAADGSNVAIIGYSRGGMHGLVGAELIPEVKGSVNFVAGTPLRFYMRDAEAQPINDALMTASNGRRTTMSRITKPVIDIIGGEDSRRKATTDLAATIGVYPTPTADNPSPIVMDTFTNMTDAYRSLIRIEDIDHFDLVDDPFIVAYRALEGTMRTSSFTPDKTYMVRPLALRQEIRDHYVLAGLDRILKDMPSDERFINNPFADQGVTVTMGDD